MPSPLGVRAERLVTFGRDRIAIEQITALARGAAHAVVDPSPAYRSRLERSQRLLERLFAGGKAPIYGLTTGVGSSVRNAIPPELAPELATNLYRLHGCGTGRILQAEEAAAVVAARIPSLASGHSGVGAELLERLCLLLNERVLPRIPAEGSVGASGDLTPLSYVAAVLAGEREVEFRGRICAAGEAFAELGVEPLELAARDSLAVMNGTSAMTGLACLAFERAQGLARLAATLTAMVSDVVRGNPEHFARQIFELKPHPGSVQAAGWIREHLAGSDFPAARLQDPYSIRCAPHVIGVLLDSLDAARHMIEIELNAADDNPLLDLDEGVVLHGGNFYGGHICAAMDSLKAQVASIADLLDRQLVLLCNPETSGGLPENLVAKAEPERLAHHGFKAMQITASALAAESLKLSMPASAFSRSTESHNQDKVSMGTIAARDCLRSLELGESVAGILLLAASQAVDLRGRSHCAAASAAICDEVRKTVSRLTSDRRQDLDIQRVVALMRDQAWLGHPRERERPGAE